MLALGCRSPSGPRTSLEVQTHQGDGFAINVVPGSKVVVNDGVLGVDSPDGFRWMEVRWIQEPVAPDVTAWSIMQCDGLIWDRDAAPIAGVRTRTGMCTQEFQEYWTFLVLETRPEGVLMTTWLSHRETLAYETAWVEFTGTAMSLSGGTTPVATMDETAVRLLLREASVTSTGPSPVPGGGELGAAVSERMTEMWTRRLASPAPQFSAVANTP
ncbi:MAG: hypothetical protein ACI855_003536 [Myxococcota bacterium]